jgi:hypothetical protein
MTLPHDFRHEPRRGHAEDPDLDSIEEALPTAKSVAGCRPGWPVRDLPGGHLHMLASPGEVAAAITGLAEQARAAGTSLGSLP